MVEVIPERLRSTWEIWNIRGVILISILLQIALFVGAPMRKRTGNRLVILLVWSSYFLAEWATSFALGLITSSQSSNHCGNSDLLAFWASFLLLHHGGPDTITAFEENELWLRHLLTLISQVVTTLYVFLQTVPESKLWLPTLLIFLAGIIKYAERTHSLYLASWRTFRESMLMDPDPGPNYAKFMESLSSKKLARLPTIVSQTLDIDIKESKPDFYPKYEEHPKLDDFAVVEYAHQHCLKIFKGLVVEHISQVDRFDSMLYFRKIEAEDALEVLEVELNFIYEILYTKVFVVHNLKGYCFRLLTFVSVWASLVLFILDYKEGLDKFDVRITYALLFVASSLEILALLKLIFSDWTLASLNKENTNGTLQKIFKIYLKIRTSKWSPCSKLDESGEKPNTNPSALSIFKKCFKFRSSRRSSCSKDRFGTDDDDHQYRTTSIVFRRWSESVAGFNLIAYCLKQLPKKFNEENADQWCLGIYKTTTLLLPRIQKFCRKNVVEPLGAQDFLDELNYASRYPFTKYLWKFIFQELKLQSEKVDKPEKIEKITSSARGSYVLGEYKKDHQGETVLLETLITDYIENVTFDESLLLWHIATDLCYVKGVSDPETVAQAVADQTVAQKVAQNRQLSKILSDYMLYLLEMKSTMMSAVAGIGQIRFRDTCADAQRFFGHMGLGPNMEKEACENLLGVNTEVKPVHVKGDKSKSVLFDACILAKELQKLDPKTKWEVICKVWVEMLAYASNHCKPDAHTKQVSRGGQLINLVWLLMAHFGLAKQFVFIADFGPAKLIVEK